MHERPRRPARRTARLRPMRQEGQRAMHLHLLYLALGLALGVLTGMAAIGLIMVIRERWPARGSSGSTRWKTPTRSSACEAGTRVR